MARQMLFGELPMRDFIDPGRPLTVALSALGQWIAPNLLSEAILTMGALAVGAAITFWLASRASRSLILGLAAAGLVIAILPRLYSYPKILVFSVTLLAVWRYVDLPTIGRLAILATTIVFAFLMRHDFGLYAGLATGALVFVTPRLFAWRRTAVFVALGVVVAAPYLVWLESIGRLRATGTSGAEKAASWLAGADMPRPRSPFDLSQGIVHIDPVRARVRVRWAAPVDAATRREAETQFGLIQPVDEGEATFAYGLTDTSVANVRALVNAPIVVDTGGIDRHTLTIDAPWLDRSLSTIGVTRIVWGPFFDSNGAGIWLYYFVWAVPILALIRLVTKRGMADPAFPHEWRKIGTAALLGILLNLYLIRGSFDSRIPDVIVPTGVAGAWLAREYIDLAVRRRWPGRSAMALAGIAVAVLFWASLTTYESTASAVRLAAAPFRVSRLPPAAAELRQRPIDFYTTPDEAGVKRLTRYVHECLLPEDRLLVVSYEPQVFYYAERLFAGGMEYFHQHRFSSPEELSETVGRLSQQRVPMVLVDRTRIDMFEQSYRPVAEYVRSHYRHAATSAFGGSRSWDVFAANARPSASVREGGLPCYR